MPGMGARATVFGVMTALAIAGCSRSHSIGSFRDALASGDASRVASVLEGAPSCAGAAGARASSECLAQAATWFGSKTGFHFDEPDQAAAAVAALAIARDGRGESIPAPDAWLFAVRSGEGPGADALRLATTARMAVTAPTLARALDADGDARALMRAVGESVAGACDTYALLGAGTDDATLPAQTRVDHSPCVQKDLDRATGPSEHGRYGAGVWRGAAGALALWRDAAAAIRAGMAKADSDTQAVVGKRLGVIDAAIGKIALKTLPPAPDLTQFMGETHDAIDAGAAIRRAVDAGAATKGRTSP
jgi:hypothetical protein